MLVLPACLGTLLVLCYALDVAGLTKVCLPPPLSLCLFTYLFPPSFSISPASLLSFRRVLPHL